MLIGEVFGHHIENKSEKAQTDRANKYCRFKAGKCTKDSKEDPLGTCCIDNSGEGVVVCPTRFVEGDRMFYDCAKIAFGEGIEFAVFPEIRVLNVVRDGKEKKIGKIDYLIGKISNGVVIDFAAIEVQGTYISGNIRNPFKHYMETGEVMVGSDVRPDFRSSAQKRMMPQLALKVPIFRRWGKKFMVVVDRSFFAELPSFETTDEDNSELTWLAYPFSKDGVEFSIGKPDIIHSEWAAVETSLREGKPPKPQDILDELQAKLKSKKANPKKLRT